MNGLAGAASFRAGAGEKFSAAPYTHSALGSTGGAAANT